MRRFLHCFGYVICVALLLVLCGQSQSQEPVRKVLKRVQTGVQKICFGDHCEYVPQYAMVEVVEPVPQDAPPPAAVVEAECLDVPQTKAACPCGPDCVCDPCKCPPSPMATIQELAAVEHRMMLRRPLRSLLEARPLQRVFAAKPLRSFLRRLFVR